MIAGKLNQLIVIISNKKGDCYQVSLNKTEAMTVRVIIADLHGGIIKVAKPKLSMEIEAKK